MKTKEKLHPYFVGADGEAIEVEKVLSVKSTSGDIYDLGENGFEKRKPLTVFISVPMRDRKAEDIFDDIQRARKDIEDYFGGTVNYEFVDNLIEQPEGSERLYCLGEAIKKIGDCDFCYFCKDWRHYSGCQVEYAVCELYDIGILEEE